MNEPQKFRVKPRLPRGFRDRDEADIAAERRMLETIRRVYESYGFSALETPAFEYTDALGKFLPDSDRPKEGVFSLKDDDEQWLSLRYDWTAPLARYVAENFQNLPKPFRRYQVGQVWRNEKPGPGRYREFTQFDADTVGSASPAADAELLMMGADALEALRLKRGEFVVKVNSRKVLNGVLECSEIADQIQRATVLRSLDKLDRIGPDGVRLLLGPGRKDESGDFTKGAELNTDQIRRVMAYVNAYHEPPFEDFQPADNQRSRTLEAWSHAIEKSSVGQTGIDELSQIDSMLSASGYDDRRIQLDGSIIRGLDYYTGPIFEAQLSAPVKNDAGETVAFGSIASGGRYDGMVSRFTGQT